MAKKGAKKSTTKKTTTKKKANSTPKTKTENNENIQKILVENFVSFQSVLVKLSDRLDNLAKQTSELLSLFKDSAKMLAEKDVSLGSDQALVDKLNQVLDQNKIIARGVALLHESNSPPTPEGSQGMMPPTAPHPSQKLPQRETVESGDTAGYQKSISSRY